MAIPYDSDWARNQSALLVTDDDGMIRLLKAPVENRGLKATVARSLDRARLEVETGAFVLAVIDLAAFGKSGLRLIESVRAHSEGRTLPIIVIAPASGSSLIAAGLTAGADNYLTQPIRTKVYEACIEVLLRQTAVEMRLKRQEVLINELSIVEAKIRRKSEEQAALTTEELAAIADSPSDDSQRTVDWPSLASGAFFLSDTEEQATRDWELFRAIEAGLSRCIERQKSLAVLTIEARALEPVALSEVDEFLYALSNRIRSVLLGRQTVTQLKEYTFCIVLPETAEAEAIWLAQRILAAVEGEGLILNDGRRRASLRIGIALLEPDHAGAPFDILDWAQHALDRAKAGSRGGWWVYHHEPVTRD